MTKEALRLALEALENQVKITNGWESVAEYKAIKAVEAALEAKDEPVAWFSTLPDGKLSIKIVGKPTEGNWEPLYTTPPQRKPLTDGEIYTAYITATNQTLRSQDERLAFAFARAIEAAHGIKDNT